MSSKNPKTEKELHKLRIKKVRIITAAITLFLIVVLIIIGISTVISYNNSANNGDYLRKEIAAAGKHFEIDGCMMCYYFNDTYNTFLKSYGSYVEYIGLFPSETLRNQYFSDGESWFDIIMRITRTSVTNIIALNEAAYDAGVTLTDEERGALRRRVDRMDTGLYGNGVNHEDIYNAKLLEALAYKYRSMAESDMKPDADYINSLSNTVSEKNMCVDYYQFPMYYPKESDGEKTESKAGSDDKTFTETEIKQFSEELAKIKNADEFIRRVKELLLLENPSLTESQLDEYAEEVKKTAVPYLEDDTLSEWAFNAKVGDTVIVADTENTTYTVYFLITEPYTDKTPTVDIRHILLYDDTYGSRESTLKKAYELLDIYENGDKSAYSFGLLALEYSEEEGSYYSGGLYEYVVNGTKIAALDTWCFDSGRLPGDTAIIETDYGCHLVRFESRSLPLWQVNIANSLINEGIEAYMTEISERYPILFDETVIDMIPD